MAEFRLRKRKQLEQEPEQGVVAVPETPSLLGHVGSAVHALGSFLSTPSRIVHGGINALTGGEGGFGNLNPLDSTGGIEASRHLIRAGILPKNDPTKWELHDVTRGLVDMAGDPMTVLTPFGLTKAGLQAAKAGTLTRGVLPQIAAGERALLTARLPFQGVIGHAGAGADVANALNTAGQVTRLTPAIKAVAGSKPVRVARGVFDSAMEGVTHPILQPLMKARFEKLQQAVRDRQAMLVRLGREIDPEDAAALKAGSTFLPSEQIHSSLEGVTAAPAGFSHHTTELADEFDKALRGEQAYGPRQPVPLNDPAIKGYGARYKSQLPGDKLTGAASGARVIKRKDMLKGFTKGTHAPGGVNDVLQKLAKEAQDPAMSGLTRKDKVDALVTYLKANHGADIAIHYTTKGGKRVNRYRQLAKYAIDNPDLADPKNKLFGNHMLADVGRSLAGSDIRRINAETVADALAKAAQPAGGPGVTLREALMGKKGSLKYRTEMAEQIGARQGIHIPNKAANATGWQAAIDSVLDQTVDPELVKQLSFAKPRREMSAAGEQAANWWQQGLGLFKSGVLAFPASRVRDLVSGHVQNLLHGWGIPGKGAYADAARVMNGQMVKRDYSHVPAVQEWFAKKGWNIADPRFNTPENQTEAIRQLIAVHLPREHGFLGDLPSGQTGFTLQDVLRNVPGKTPTTTFRQFVADPLNTMRTLDPQAWNPLNVRGVGGRTDTGFAPIKASEKFSEASDVLNRGAGFLDQLHGGTNVNVAARNVNRAQINYDPATYSATEKLIKRNVAPFYSFTSRIVPETARQIADLGSPTSQLLKAQDRMYGENPAVPDYIADSAGVPMGRRPDGTLEFLSGLGLMHEPATKMLGQAVQGDAKGLTLNALAMLNPFMAKPLEGATGVSLSRDGEPLANLESNSGRLLSNMAVLAGLRDPEAGPVRYAGQNALDFLAGLTPADRLLSTARQLTDTRRGIGGLLTSEEPATPGKIGYELAAGLGPAVSGLRVTDVSPRKQLVTLRKRAEELAKEAGAKSREDVYFSKDQLARLRETDPALAARQEELQHLVNSLKAGRQVKQKEPGEFRLRKKEKSEG